MRKSVALLSTLGLTVAAGLMGAAPAQAAAEAEAAIISTPGTIDIDAINDDGTNKVDIKIKYNCTNDTTTKYFVNVTLSQDGTYGYVGGGGGTTPFVAANCTGKTVTQTITMTPADGYYDDKLPPFYAGKGSLYVSLLPLKPDADKTQSWANGTGPTATTYRTVTITDAPVRSWIGISTIKFNAPGTDSTNLNGEYIQLKNLTKKNISGANYKLVTPSRTFTLANLGTFSPNETVTIHSGSGTQNSPAGNYYLFSKKEVWPNSAGTAILINPKGDVIDRYDYTRKAGSIKTYENCTAVHKDYPYGIGLVGAVESEGRTTFTQNNALYFRNDALDRDKDGVACEA